jgi:hypothetical protein
MTSEPYVMQRPRPVISPSDATITRTTGVCHALWARMTGRGMYHAGSGPSNMSSAPVNTTASDASG